MIGRTRIGFNLKNTKHYATAEAAIKAVERTLEPLHTAGVVFNIIVEQRKGFTCFA